MSGFRRSGRKPIKCPVKLSHENAGEFTAETTNISDSGIFVASNDFLQYVSVGDKVSGELSCETATDCQPASNTEMKVVRLTYDGAGLEFA